MHWPRMENEASMNSFRLFGRHLQQHSMPSIATHENIRRQSLCEAFAPVRAESALWNHLSPGRRRALESHGPAAFPPRNPFLVISSLIVRATARCVACIGWKGASWSVLCGETSHAVKPFMFFMLRPNRKVDQHKAGGDADPIGRGPRPLRSDGAGIGAFFCRSRVGFLRNSSQRQHPASARRGRGGRGAVEQRIILQKSSSRGWNAGSYSYQGFGRLGWFVGRFAGALWSAAAHGHGHDWEGRPIG